MRTINLEYLRNMAPYLEEANYDEHPRPDLSHYDAYVTNFKNIVGGDDDESAKSYMQGMRDTLAVVLCHPDRFALNEWLINEAGHGLGSEERVCELLQRVWNVLFPDQAWDNPRYRDEPYEEVHGETEY